MAVDIEQAGAVIGFVNQMVVPDLVVQGCRFGRELKLLNRNREGRNRAETPAVSAASKGARKFRGRRRRKPPEETAGQARMIVDDDASAGRAGAIWNHFR